MPIDDGCRCGCTGCDLEQVDGLLGLGHDREGDVFELHLVGLDALKVEDVAHQRQQMLRTGWDTSGKLMSDNYCGA
jgi:hypothetical protein